MSPPGLLVLGQAYLQAEDYEKARLHLETALAGNPRLTNAHYALAAALAGLGQAEQAQKHREEYARLKQQDLALFDELRGAGREVERVKPGEVGTVVSGLALRAGKIYAARGKLPKAETLWLTAVRLNPRDPEPQRLLESLRSGRP